MSVIRLDLYGPVMDGDSTAFRAPCACSSVTGLKVYYPDGETTKSTSFTLVDANGQSITNAKSAFCSGALVTVVFDVTNSKAYIQNGDTNKYLEDKFAAINTSLSGKAASSHGTHVPTPQTADNKKFLRNDNTWQEVTPANIGAAEASHSHDYVPTSKIANNATTTSSGYVADARQIKSLRDATKAGQWTVTKITSEGGFGTKSFSVDTTKHDFIVIEVKIAGNMANRLIPCGIVGTFGTYTDGAGYSATNVGITCTTTTLTFTLGSTNQTESLKVYYLDRK